LTLGDSVELLSFGVLDRTLLHESSVRFIVDSWQAPKNRRPRNDLLYQDSVLSEWFERRGDLCLKFFLPSSYDFRRRIGPGERTPD
jgi:hypothetical protein